MAKRAGKARTKKGAARSTPARRARKATRKTVRKAAKRAPSRRAPKKAAARRAAKGAVRKRASKTATAPVETLRTPPSSLDLSRGATAARSGRKTLDESRRLHSGMSALTGGDADADVESAYFTGDEAAGGDNPTPDQSDVDDIGHAIGVEYQDDEELKGAPKVDARDKHRWELDPASSDDYKERKR